MKKTFLHFMVLFLSVPAFSETEYPSHNTIKDNLLLELGPDGANAGPKVNSVDLGASPSTIKNYPDADGLQNPGYNDRAGKALEAYLLEKHAEAESKGVWAGSLAPALNMQLPGSSPVEKKAGQILSNWGSKALQQGGEFQVAAAKNYAHCKLLRRPHNQENGDSDAINEWEGCEEATIQPATTQNAEIYFSDTMLSQLEESGVDTASLKYKLDHGDFDSAKEILNRVGQEKTLDDAEEEVAELVARRIRLGKYKKSLNKESYQDQNGGTVGENNTPTGTYSENADGTQSIVYEDQGEANGSGVRLIRKSHAANQLPGVRYGEDRIYVPGSAKRRQRGESTDDVSSQTIQVEMDTYGVRQVRSNAADYDVYQLKNRGVRKLIPGMTIFRFAHHRYAEWDSKNAPTQKN